MRTQIAKKIILKTFAFFIIFSCIVPTSITYAAIGGEKLNWENPNKSGNNPYKFKLTDSLNSKLIMDVIGCTGVVNKVSGAITGFAQKQSNEIMDKLKKRAAEKATQAGIKGVGIGAASTATSPGSQAGTGVADVIVGTTDDVVTKPTEDSSLKKAQDETNAKLAAQSKREECLNGIAFTLAKNQLTAMTRSTMNWIATGFNGDPMYVQNANSFMNSITSSILEKEISLFKDKTYYPYGSDYARSATYGYRSLLNFKDSMKQNLSYYLNSGGLGEDAANVVTGGSAKNASNIMERYANDFNMGGWNGWLAFTQQPQNNPLGYNIYMAEYIAQKQNTDVTNTKEELARNGGILDQKKCVKYASSIKKAAKEINQDNAQYNSDDFNEKIMEARDGVTFAQENYNTTYKNLMADPKNKDKEKLFKAAEKTLGNAQKTYNNIMAEKSSLDASILTPEGDECVEWQVVTPGSVIKDKISTYINSPERQLELSDTINEALNSLFSMLISKLQHNGLSSLSSDANEFYDASGGYGSNKIYDTEGNEVMGTTSGGFSGPFDITKDLGNIYTTPVYAGSWDAMANKTTNTTEGYLSKGVGTKNTFYVVSVGGSTSLFDGNTSWLIGDKAFFDGTSWRKGVPEYVIEKKGIIQTQQDYINNAQEVLKVLPKVMPAIGELDYCIPGPNPSWESNSSDAYSTYSDWLYAIMADTRIKTGRDAIRIKLPDITSREYKNYQKIFEGTGLWQKVINSTFFNSGSIQGDYAKKLWNQSYGDYTHPFYRLNDSCNGETEMFDWKGEKCQAKAQEVINLGVNKWASFLENNMVKYTQIINSKYGNNKNSTDNINNPFGTKYIEMAQTGQAITKNILQYNEKINESIINYRDSIVEGCSNIYKLNQIKEKVNTIVKAAQARREKEGIEVSSTCKQAELGTYLVDDKPLLKGCGNTQLEETPEEKNEKLLEVERQAQRAEEERIMGEEKTKIEKYNSNTAWDEIY